jgi:hypothetical protein
MPSVHFAQAKKKYVMTFCYLRPQMQTTQPVQSFGAIEPDAEFRTGEQRKKY